MIESRYKIEYVLPDKDVNKTSPFKALWYLLLIPLVILIVTAITYDFSFKEISRDSLVLLEKVKVHVFNLEDHQRLKKLDKQTNVAVSETLTPTTTSKTAEKQTVSSTPIAPKPLVNKNKIKITDLTTKQELQLKAIQKQIAENTTLTQNLNKLSEQLVLEQIKNQELNSKLAAQEKDRLDLEEQLNNMLEDSIDNEMSLEDLSTQDNVETNIVLEAKVLQNKDTPQTKPAEVVQAPKKEDKTEQSETDKIIEAMTIIATDKNTEVKVNTIIEPESTENKKPSPISVPILVTKETKDITTAKNEVKEIENMEVKIEVSNKSSELQEKVDTNIEVSSEPSPVDAIIAAMQEPPSNSNNNNVPDTKQKVDPELEKEIKQQLVEKSELSIDN